MSNDAIEQTAGRAGLSDQVSHEMIGSEVAQRLMPQVNFRNPQHRGSVLRPADAAATQGSESAILSEAS